MGWRQLPGQTDIRSFFQPASCIDESVGRGLENDIARAEEQVDSGFLEWRELELMENAWCAAWERDDDLLAQSMGACMGFDDSGERADMPIDEVRAHDYVPSLSTPKRKAISRPPDSPKKMSISRLAVATEGTQLQEQKKRRLHKESSGHVVIMA